MVQLNQCHERPRHVDTEAATGLHVEAIGGLLWDMLGSDWWGCWRGVSNSRR